MKYYKVIGNPAIAICLIVLVFAATQGDIETIQFSAVAAWLINGDINHLDSVKRIQSLEMVVADLITKSK